MSEFLFWHQETSFVQACADFTSCQRPWKVLGFFISFLLILTRQGPTFTKTIFTEKDPHEQTVSTNCRCHYIIWSKLLSSSPKKSINKKRNIRKIKMSRLAFKLVLSWTITKNVSGFPRVVMVKALDCGIVVSEFEL